MTTETIAYNKVLVTGGTGFIGCHVLDILLQRGLNVRAAVRNLDKAQKLANARPQFASQLEFVEIADFSGSLSFQDAVQGVDGIVHMASPLTYDVQDNEKDLILPAINGVNSILQAAATNPNIKRVVITSSFASVVDINRKYPPPYRYSSSDWNPLTYEEAADNASGAVVAYRGSKKFAELAAWDFVKRTNPGFDIVTLCPPMVFGPIAHPVAKLSELNDSAAMLWKLASGVEPFPVARVPFWVDVRDLACAHVSALLLRRAGNKRFTVASPQKFTYEMAAKIMVEEFESLREQVCRSPTPQEINRAVELDGDTAAQDLSFSYRAFRESVKDFVSQVIQLEATEKAQECQEGSNLQSTRM